MKDLSQDRDIPKTFGSGPSLTDDEPDIELDLVLGSVMSAAQFLLTDQPEVKRSVLPQLLSLFYHRASSTIGRIEFHYTKDGEDESEDKVIKEVLFESIEDEVEIIKIKFFADLISAIQHFGIGKYDYKKPYDVVSDDDFMTFVKNHLCLSLSKGVSNHESLMEYVKAFIVKLREHSEANQTPANQLIADDMHKLHQCYVKQFISLKEAFFHVARVEGSFRKLRQSIFEPVFKRFCSAEGYLSLTGSFYQSLLFISKANVKAVYRDAKQQQKAHEFTSGRTRSLIDSLKNKKKFEKIGLTKFTETCLEIGMSSQMESALKKLNKIEVMAPSTSFVKICEAIDKIGLESKHQSTACHGNIKHELNKNAVQIALVEAANRANISSPSRFSASLMVNRQSQHMVFDVIRTDRQRPSFDIYFDCSMNELVEIIKAANPESPPKTKSGPKKKQTKHQIRRSTEVASLQSSRQSIFDSSTVKLDVMEESKIINVTKVKPNKTVAEIAVQTGYSLNGRIEQFESIDYSKQRDDKVNMS